MMTLLKSGNPAWTTALFTAGALLPGLGAADLVPWDTTWRFFKGWSEASHPDPTTWRAPDFDDSTWELRAAPFWYGDVQPSPGTRLDDMRGNYTCIFVRHTFSVTEPHAFSTLELEALSDDGFIAWINGQEVARFNMPDGYPGFNGSSSPALPEPIPSQTFVIEDPSRFLVSGQNVLAVQGYNSSLANSSDFILNASLTAAVDQTPPVVSELIPPDRATVRELSRVEVHFSEPVQGVDAADLLVNGQPCSSVTLFAPGVFVFEFAPPAPGAVTLTWTAGHGIRDFAAAANPFAGGSWSYTLNPDAPVPGVMISEFMADNDNTLNDEDGDSSDWIELFNPTDDRVSLLGWFLTDNPSRPTRWRFPNVALAPRSHLLLFASGKNRTQPANPLHTNFRLDAQGGYLALLDSTTNVVSEFNPYPAQLEDVSYGRDRVAPEMLGFFPQPTPGRANSLGGPGFSPEVRFSVRGGTFRVPFELSLDAPHPQAAIYYTLNGSMPTNTSTLYTGPLAITNTVQVRARAIVPGLLPGAPRSEGFIRLGPTVLNATSDLPLLLLHTFGRSSIPADSDAFAQLLVFEPRNGVSSLTNTPDTRARTGINLRGSSTLGYPKSSYSLECWNEFDDDRNVSLLGMPADSDWVLYAPNNFEPILIHNSFAHALSRQIGRYSPRTRFVELYVTRTAGEVTSAHYAGVYVLEEKISRGPDRVDVATLADQHTRPPQVTGGYLMKIDRAGAGERVLYAGGAGVVVVYPRAAVLDLPQRRPQVDYLQNYLDAFYGALMGPNFTHPTLGYAAYVEPDSWIDHHLLNIITFNVDALRLSAYFYKPREGRLAFGPLWDFDRALNSTDGRDANPRVWRSRVSDRGTDFFGYGTQPWWGRLFSDLEFWQRYVDRWQELRDGPFSLTSLYALIDAQTGELAQAQPREVQRWPGHAPRGGSYAGEVRLLKTWLSNRVDFIDTNFLAKPRLGQPAGPIVPGAQVTLSGPAGADLFYTLDGSDPRLPGGGVSPSALSYSGPVTVEGNARLVARARKLTHRNLTGGDGNPPLSTPWSAPAAATYVAATPPLVITEIHYHPEPPPGNAADAEAFEYIELRNRGTVPLDLPGFRFTAGIQFEFTPAHAVTRLAPGAFVVLVKNLAAFTSRYPGVTNVAGEYAGSLDNAGERLALEGPLREPILDFAYDDAWFPITDGPGFSLVIRDDTGPLDAWALASSWRPSAQRGGSPGQPDPAAPVFPPVLINEVLTHTDPPLLDAVELFNPTTNPAELSGWFLTDNFDSPRKFVFPPNSIVPPGGFLVLTEADFNTGPNAFNFSSLGEEAYLFSADGTGLTGYVHGFGFGAAANGVSFGRHVSSTGREYCVAQAYRTLDAPNAGPLLGPVVINEIQFHPPPVANHNNTLEEFVELRNASADPVPLFDPAAPTNTWRVQKGIEFDFPQGFTLSPGGFVLLVNFDPAIDFGPLAAFRTRYEVPPGIPILGPYRGNLSNEGERLTLSRPDPPQAPGTPNAGVVPYVVVDQVEYSPLPPWPGGAEGTGQSLQRRVPVAFAEDPASWQVATPTAGRANPAPDPDVDRDGLPDEWELAHGLDPLNPSGDDGPEGDPDQDGLTNLEEYQAGTHPRDPGSRLAISAVALSDVETLIRFEAVAGRTYTILFCDDLALGLWMPLAEVPAPAVTGEIAVRDPARQTTRFYRLATP
ncbi:MAG: lamin tail domain-containing protein [Verrucomicrobiales bacterium]|nr:lamin tail domain-containing protein [Verrucomicrobiales bacterium]